MTFFLGWMPSLTVVMQRVPASQPLPEGKQVRIDQQPKSSPQMKVLCDLNVDYSNQILNSNGDYLN